MNARPRIEVDRPEDRRVVDEALAHGHGHVFRFWEALAETGRRALLDQLAEIDFQQIDRLAKEALRADDASLASLGDRLRPPRLVPLPRSAEQTRARDGARDLGEKLLGAGRVAVMVVAGGQGTRLGFDLPKGMYPIGPVTDRTLFRLHAEKILAAGRRWRRPLLWMIMTSEATHDATVAYFDQERRFGLRPEDVMFLKQGMMPAVDRNGLLLLAEKGRIATSPNGHGGALLALRDSGALEELRSRGVDTIYYFQVDNPIVPVPDPALLGYHCGAGAEMSSKVVAKTHPGEKVGVVAEVDGRTRVIEYSDLDPEAAELREPDGQLRFRAGSIAVHVLDRTFVERQTERGLRLPFHVARKKVPFVDGEGHLVEPEEKNGIKFETFIFDALPEAEITVTQEVDRHEEFAPVKNASGPDSPETARQLMSDLYGRWMRDGGAEVPKDASGRVRGRIEISPLFALDAEECARKVRRREIRFRDGLVLTENDG